MHILLEFICKLLLSCGLFLGGLFFVLKYVYSKPSKVFKVTDKNRTRTVLLPYFSSESFTEKCRAEFNLGNDEKILFASGKDEKKEVNKDFIGFLENKSLLIVKRETDALGNNDDDDAGTVKRETDASRNDVTVAVHDDHDEGRVEVRGTKINIVDTVVDNADIKKWENIQEGGEVKQHIVKYGLKDITSVLRENVDAWKSKPLNIAVTGESGKGKSSFINAFRGLSCGQIGAAEVDEEECTRDCRAFRHPKYDSFVLWDVPGVGTNNFPKTKYLNNIKVDRYDFFMIISANRFSELDTWLAKEVRKRQKRFYFIRTKIDIDMVNKRKRFLLRKQDFDEMNEFEKMKSDIFDKLKKVFWQVDESHFFMISNNDPGKFDFPFILDQLLLDVPTGKKDAMVFGLRGMSKSIMEEKASALKSRIWKVALLSGVGAGIPIPFVSAGIDIALILEEILFYREQFGLDDQSLEHLADMAGTSLEELKSSVELRTPESLFTSAGLSKYLMKYAVKEAAETAVKYTIPVFGIAISCGMSFSTTMGILEELLQIMKIDALKVLEYATTSRGTAV